jgi:hypothetical protein
MDYLPDDTPRVNPNVSHLKYQLDDRKFLHDVQTQQLRQSVAHEDSDVKRLRFELDQRKFDEENRLKYLEWDAKQQQILQENDSRALQNDHLQLQNFSLNLTNQKGLLELEDLRRSRAPVVIQETVDMRLFVAGSRTWLEYFGFLSCCEANYQDILTPIAEMQPLLPRDSRHSDEFDSILTNLNNFFFTSTLFHRYRSQNSLHYYRDVSIYRPLYLQIIKENSGAKDLMPLLRQLNDRYMREQSCPNIVTTRDTITCAWQYILFSQYETQNLTLLHHRCLTLN